MRGLRVPNPRVAAPSTLAIARSKHAGGDAFGPSIAAKQDLRGWREHQGQAVRGFIRSLSNGSASIELATR